MTAPVDGGGSGQPFRESVATRRPERLGRRKRGGGPLLAKKVGGRGGRGARDGGRMEGRNGGEGRRDGGMTRTVIPNRTVTRSGGKGGTQRGAAV